MQDLHKRCPAKIFAQDLYTSFHGKTLEKISKRDLHTLRDLELRSLLQLSINDLWATSQLSSPAICTRSLRGLLARSMYKISIRALRLCWQDLCARFLLFCERVQSKCTWTCHKAHFMPKFTGKMTNALDTTSNEHRALTRIPSVWPLVLGNISA